MTKRILTHCLIITSFTLAACGGAKKEPTGFDRKVAKLYASIDTAKIITEADVVTQYQTYLELKKKNKEVLENEPLATIEDLDISTFFMSQKIKFMDLRSKSYEEMEAKMDSLDKVYKEK